jgi:SAM-dependent methyltransferase
MTHRRPDGSAGDADYGTIGVGYRQHRRPDPRIAAVVHEALGDARTVLNVGAGAGSYEPADRIVTAVEPSAAMRGQRPADLVTAIDAVAEALPFGDRSFDAAMTTFSVHQWPDLDAGLGELRRVTRGPILVLSADPARLDRWWLAEYGPEVIAVEAGRYPAIARLSAGLDGPDRVVECRVVPVTLDCHDGFNEAYYGRPESLLGAAARRANSAWSFVDQAAVERFERRLAGDLETGEWDRRFGHLRTQPTLDGSLVLVTSTVRAR